MPRRSFEAEAGGVFSGEVWSLNVEAAEEDMLVEAREDYVEDSPPGLSLLYITLAVSMMGTGVCL